MDNHGSKDKFFTFGTACALGNSPDSVTHFPFAQANKLRSLTLKYLCSSNVLIKRATTGPLFPEAWYSSLSRFDDFSISIEGEMVCCSRRVVILYDPVWKKSVRILFSFEAQIRFLKGMPISCEKNTARFGKLPVQAPANKETLAVFVTRDA